MKYIREYNEYTNTYYHGSSIKLDKLKLIEPVSGESNFLGDGIYITNNKEIASLYGEYLYEVTLTEQLNSLQYFGEIDVDLFKKISKEFQNSDNSDLNQIGDNIEDSIIENDIWWGKYLISELDRYDLNSEEILIRFGYNAIESPMNKLNKFIDRPEYDRNICIIKPNIINIVNSMDI